MSGARLPLAGFEHFQSSNYIRCAEFHYLIIARIIWDVYRGGHRHFFRAFARSKKSKKNSEFALVSPTHNGNPVSEPKAAQLSKMYSSVC